MLIDEPAVMYQDTVLSVIGGGRPVKHLRTGCYEIPHFGHSHFLRDEGFDSSPSYDKTTYEARLPIGSYGVCDDLENLLAACPQLEGDPDRQFVVTLTRIDKSDQEEDGGWRWHKWGEYIGKQKPTTEYIYDEPIIETVFCYHIYEKMK